MIARPDRLVHLLGAAMLVAALFVPLGAAAQAPAPAPAARTPIEHLIVLTQENHTFDNYFGTYPGVDGIPEGVCMPVDPADPSNTECVKPFHIGSSVLRSADLDHSSPTHRRQFAGGAMNGFVSALNGRQQDGRLAMGYYDRRDLPYHWALADNYVLYDHFFSSASTGSAANHTYMVTAAQPVGRDGKTTDSIPADGFHDQQMTIFDRLEERGVSWKFYVQNYEPALTYRTLERYQGNRASQVIWVPLLAMDRFIDDPKLASKIVDLSEYFKDLENGTLPAVAYVVPSGASEHPPGSLMSGQRFVVSLLNSLQRSDYWEKSAFFLTYDDWGGWYDHVPPEQIDKYGYGFRVPSMLISPYARRGHVEHEVLDFTSILKFIEENWGVDPLSDRDLNAKSIAGGFDFGQAPRAPFFISGLPPDPPRPEPPRTVILLGYGSALVFPLLLIAWTLRSGRAKTGAASPATTPTRLEDTQP